MGFTTLLLFFFDTSTYIVHAFILIPMQREERNIKVRQLILEIGDWKATGTIFNEN